MNRRHIEVAEAAAPAWKNEVTLRSVEAMLSVEPAAWAALVSPKPFLMIVGARDTCTFTEHQLDTFEHAREPKKLVIHPGGHFDTYTDHFELTAGAAVAWFQQNFPLSADDAGPQQFSRAAPPINLRPLDRTEPRMPLCDAYIPNGALEPAAERDFIKRVSDILVSHEARRIIDLMDDPKEVESVHRRAGLISWLFVHRTEAYVDGRPVPAPLYRFLVSIPEGQIDEVFVPAINRDIFQALKDAEPEGREHLERRLWITVQEVVDGMWGSAGRQLRLKEIVDVVAPGWGEHASTRFAEKTRTDAQALVKLAQDRGVAA